MSTGDKEGLATPPSKRIQQYHPATILRRSQTENIGPIDRIQESGLPIRSSSPSATKHHLTAAGPTPVHTPAPRTFQFVNVTKASGTKDKIAQKLVRSYATKRHWELQRKQDLALARRHDPNFSPASFAQLIGGRCTCSFSQLIETKTTASAESSNLTQLQDTPDPLIAVPTTPDNINFSFYLPQSTAPSTRLLCSSCGKIVLPSRFAPTDLPPLSIMRVGNSDPFSSFPIETQPHMHELIDHYGSVLGPMLLPVDSSGTLNPLRTLWISKAMADPAMFHATLCVAALHLALLKPDTLLRTVRRSSGGPKAPIFAIHKEEAIKLINDKLSTTSATSDFNIGALLTIASCETFTGNLADYKKNATVLQELVRRRGGLQNLGMDSLLHQMCQWVDNCGSAMTNTKPIFEYLQVDKFCTPAITELPDIQQMYPLFGEGIHIFKDTGIFQEQTWSIYLDLLSLTNEMNWTRSRPIKEANMISFSDRRASVEYRLTSMSSTDGILKPADDHRYIQESSRIAALLYANRVLRAMPNNAAMIGQLLHLLMRCLQRTNLDRRWGKYSELLLWVLFLGGTATTTAADHIWFVTQVTILAAALKLKSWMEVKGILERYLYPEHVLEKLCISFWEDIEAALV